MKSSRSYSLFALLALTACAHQEMDIATNELFIPKEVYAELEQTSSNDTRVYADAQLRVLWNNDDRITMFSKYSYGYQYRFKGRTGATAGKFELIEEDGSYITGNELPYIYSVYPYQELTEIDNDGIITIDLPAEQTYAANSFGLGANTMVSISENNEMRFKNVCGYFGLQLYGDNVSVSSITLKGKNGEQLAGTANITPVLGSTPTMKFDSNYPTTETLTLNCPTPVQIGTTADESTIFWIVVPPTVFSKGLTITVQDQDGKIFVKTTTKTNEVKRNTLLRMPAIEVECEEPDASDDPIVFADENVKAKLVASFDTNDDGELSYAEAAEVTSLDGVFGSTRTYSSFDEFQFFTAVTKVSKSLFEGWLLTSIKLPESIVNISDAAFKDCSRLTSVNIPSSVKRLSNDIFNGCSRLTSVVIPNTITEIGNSAFYNCESLTSLEIPESVTAIGGYAFWGCKSLTSINIPVSITSIGPGTFRHCSSLASILLPETVTSIGLGAFASCSSLSSISIPRGVYRLEQEIFSHCNGLKDVVIPEWVTIIGPTAFYDCKGLTTLTISESVSSIGSSAFLSCTNLTSITVKSKTPAIGGRDMLDGTNNCPIFVPSESVDSYKSAEYWSDYADRIQAIPSVPVPEAVDLGLPSGVKWASFNLGASAPEEFGDYYAWGETETKSDYSWSYYEWGTSSITLTKYVMTSDYGNVDELSLLEASDDVVQRKLGMGWHLPTIDDWKELYDSRYTTWTWDSNNKGYIVRSIVPGQESNSIFLPAGGYFDNSSLQMAGSFGRYWSSTLYYNSEGNYNSSMGFGIGFNYGGGGPFGSSRQMGFSIRPVSK